MATDAAASKPLLPPAADYGKSQSSASEWEEDGYRGHSFFHGRNMADEDKAAGGSMRWWAAALILFYFVLGITYYTYFADPEHFDFLDSVYFCVTTRAAQESEIPNFKGSYLGRFPLVSANSWTSDHLSELSRSVDAFFGTRARGTLTLKRR